MNIVILSGSLGRDPETRYLPSGDAVCEFSMATKTRWIEKSSGEKKEATEWHACVAYGTTGETIAKWMKKGSGIQVEGKLRSKSWEKEGVKHSKTEIVVERFHFPPSSGNRDEKPSTGQENRSGEGAQKTGSVERKPASRPTPSFAESDEIPF
jgi:single-strand DNA-binding protein